MELKKYIFPLRRWWWLCVAATLVAAVSSFLVTLQQPPIYQARTTIMIGRAIEDPNPTSSEFWLGQQLAGTYADIANRELVRNATMAALGWNWLPEYQARALNNSQILEIVVTDVDPERAQIVANELANQLVLQSPTSAGPDEQSRQEFVSEQLDTLEAQIKQTQEDIAVRQAELGNMVSARQINDTQNQIAALQTKLSTLQGNYANLLSNTQRGAVNTLSVIEPAVTPTRPIGPAKAVSILVASMIGFVLAASAAYLLEYLDDTLKSPDDIRRAVGHPVIGYIPEAGQEQEPIVAVNPRHPNSEAFRSLRTNLGFVAVDNPLKTILVTSPETEDGKTSIAVNLAMIMAQADKKVILVDADLRRPGVHHFLDIPNRHGLSDVFLGNIGLHNAMQVWGADKIALISGGSPPPNPAELLASRKMDQILTSLEDVSDLVIVDGPPFAVTDAAVLASKVDGVLLVVRPGYTREATAKAMMEQIERAGAKVVGVVLNRIPDKLLDYYGGQLYLSYYYPSQEEGDTKPVAVRQNGVKGWMQKVSARSSQDVMDSFRPNARRRNGIRTVEAPKRSNK